jgi:tyrosyl-tRNA synthetase
MDLEEAGFDVVVLLADIHAMLNRKGSKTEIKRWVSAWRKTIRAIGMKAKVVLGSDFQFKNSYQFDVMSLAQGTTIKRGLRSMQEIARDIGNASVSQLWYPLMQAVDIKALKVDVALGGLEQRKVHMIAKDMSKVLGHEFVAFHTPLITSLKGPGQKMSKSIVGSGIAVNDSKKEIEKTIRNAYCPEKKVEDNPVLQIAQLVVFPLVGEVEIKRDEKYGGNLKIKKYEDLEELYVSGDLHPMDLKSAVAGYLEKIIAPIRKNFRK